MNTKVVRDDNKVIVYIDGEIDTLSAPGLTETLKKSITNEKELVLDFEKVDYISSAGLRALLLAQRMMGAKKGKMILVHVNSDVMEVFELTCFTDFLTIE